MSCSRRPGVLGSDGFWAGSRTPGTLGINDQADPNLCSLLGDTPGVLGRADGADPTLARLGAAAAGATAVRLDDGTVLALPTGVAANDQDLAPWMKFAEDQARQHKGAKEGQIQKVTNFHKEVGTGQTSMEGTEHAWCAAFVNWCLLQAGIDIDNESFADHVAAKGRAHAFFEVRKDKVKKGEKQAPPVVRNPLFVQLDGPVFGAVAMVTNPGGQGKHVGFVHAKPGDNTVVLLGGNQADTIKFSEYNIAAVKAQTVERAGKKTVMPAKPNHLMFFLPQGHELHAPALAKRLGTDSAEALNQAFGISAAQGGAAESTR
ncbi:hypothetical protein BurJ1DRAFT_2814 [Burkholderiales bacterium JOSHI_001]|nr:hypothetical protein BurJ1DRAFT_2814 [Burkholderiales bacterium JOSHI_001]